MKKMKKIIFIIDDAEWLKRHYHASVERNFQAVCTVYVKNNKPNRCLLTDFRGKSITRVNNYEKNAIIKECIFYAANHKVLPFGVIGIKE